MIRFQKTELTVEGLAKQATYLSSANESGMDEPDILSSFLCFSPSCRLSSGGNTSQEEEEEAERKENKK